MRLFINTIYILFLTFFFQSIVIANSELNLRLDIIKSIINTSHNLNDIDITHEVNDNAIEKIIQDEYRKITRYLLISQYKTEDAQTLKNKVNLILRSINFTSIRKTYINNVKKLQRFIRKKGINYISYVVLTNLLQITIPSILALNGLNASAVFAFYILSDLPSYFYYRAGESFLFYKNMISLFGDKDKYIQYKRELKAIRDKININDENVLYNNDGKYVTIGRQKKIRSLTNFLRITQRNSVNFNSILSFAQNHNAYDSVAKFIQKTKRFDHNTKTLLLIHHLKTTLPPHELIVFNNLINNFSQASQTSNSIAEITRVALKIQNLDSKSELKESLIELSKVSENKIQFFEIYQEVLLPYLANHSKYLTLEDFRNLSTNIYKFKVDSNKANDKVGSEVFRNRLNNYMDISFQSRSSRCLGKLDQIFSKLLK